ncbi:MAG: DUF4255 domain-containing protein [Algicola sp.]|nr:DUF4255 domain-containing protein [Algicola sp.]
MSNYLAIATTTAIFAQKINESLNRVANISAAPNVVTKRPDKPDSQMVGAYVYLYKVEHNHNLRNNDLATRATDGTLIKQPQVALDLDYHVTFYGRESTLEAQRLMGAVITDLHANPTITRVEIENFLEAQGEQSYLAESNLYEQRAAINIMPVQLSVEDISKMWSVFFQMPHEQSLNYRISVILMESDLPLNKAERVKRVKAGVKLR